MHGAVLDKKVEPKESPMAKPRCRPLISVYETDDAYQVFVELAGADPKSVQVQVQQGILTISATLAVDAPPPGAKLQYSEIALGDYERCVAVGENISEEKIEAQFSNGLLKLTLPKNKSVRGRKIAVKVA